MKTRNVAISNVLATVVLFAAFTTLFITGASADAYHHPYHRPIHRTYHHPVRTVSHHRDTRDSEHPHS